MATPAIILAFGFGNLLMLGWLGAAAAPLIIHLWNKRKYRETSWAAVEFLMAALRRNARRIQLRQWLLLAVRTAIIVLVVLAVAEPFLERIGMTFVAGQRTLKVMVIDGSYSMAYRPTDNSRFARAKQLARQIVDESNQGDGFALVLMSDPPKVIVGTPALEPRDFLEEIDALKMPHGGGDLTATLARVDEVLTRAKKEHPGLEQFEVFFLTDLHTETWSLPTGKKAEAFRAQLDGLADRASLVVLDLGQDDAENLAVTSLAAASPFTTVWRDATFQAQVKNFGSQPRRRQSALRFERVLGAQVSGIDLSAKREVLCLLAIQFAPSAPEDPQGEVTLVFAGGGAVKLKVECVEAELKDLGPVWAARAQPVHPDKDTDAT